MDNSSTAELLEERTTANGGRAGRRIDWVAEIIGYWWAKRWFILKTLTIAMAVFIPLLLLVPKLYRAEATIMIVPPRFMPEQRPEPLSISTAKNLLGSGELIQQVLLRVRQGKAFVDSLLVSQGVAGSPAAVPLLAQVAAMEPGEIRSKYSRELAATVQSGDEATSSLVEYLADLNLPELTALAEMDRKELAEMTVQDLAESFDSEDIVEKKTAVDVRFSPLLKLFATADSGPKAQLLVNTWARLFEKMYGDLTVSKTLAQYNSISKQQTQTQAALEKAQDAVVEFKADHNLELYQKQIDEYSEEYREFSRQLTLKSSALESEKGRLEELQRLGASMEENNAWVGRVDVAFRKAETATTPALLATPGVLADAAASTAALQLNLSPEQFREVDEDNETGTDTGDRARDVIYQKLRHQAVQSRTRLGEAILELNEFYRQQPLQLMLKERDQLQNDYLEALSKWRTGQVRLSVLRKGVADIDDRLSATQSRLTFSTEIPQESIANSIVQGTGMDRLRKLEFSREEMNPEWEGLAQGKARLVEELQILESEVQNLGTDLPKKEAQLRKLQDDIYRFELSEQFMKENLDRWQRTNQELFDLYVETNNSIAGSARQVRLLEVEVANLKNSTDLARSRVEEYQKMFDEAASQLTLLESRQKAAQRQADMLLQKLQDAQIAVSGEISDVSVAAAAVTPDRHFFPRRSVFTLLFGFMASALLLGILARNRYAELQQAYA